MGGGVTTGEALVVGGAGTTEGGGGGAGEVITPAARLQGAAPVNGIVVGELTYRATRDAVEFRDAEPIAAKGKSEPVPIWEVVRLRDEMLAASDSAPTLVGRAAELQHLRTLWEEARRGRRLVANVVGPPGVGKTRLLAEIIAELTSEAAILRGRCLSYGEGITYWPITEIVKNAVGILSSDDAETSSNKLGTLLDRLPTGDADELRTMAATVANLVGAARTPRGTYAAAEIGQSELHWGVRRLLELLAAEQPLVVVVEDLHWAEPTLLDLLRFIAEGSRDAPMLLLTSARPELLESGNALVTANGYRHVIELDALGEEESRSLLNELAGGRPLPASLVETVLRRADGNPLFLEELVGMVADQGLLAGGRELELESLPVPDTVQAVIGSRLDGLEPAAKRTSQHASVIGQVFWRGAVALLAETNGATDDALDELARRDFVRPHLVSTVAGEREYSFKHILIRDVAYGRLPKARRADLHLRFSAWVEGLPGSEEELVEIVAYHLEQSCRLAGEIAHRPVQPPLLRAVEAPKRAAEKASRRASLREGDRFLARAFDVVGDEHPEALLELRVQRGRMLAMLGEIARAVEQLLVVVEQAPELGRLDLRCASLITVGSIDLRLGHPGESRPRLLEAEALAIQLGDRRLQVKAGFELSALYSDFDGEFGAATEKLASAISIAEEIDDQRLVVEGHLRLGFLLFNMGDLAGAEDALQRCLTFAARLGR